MKRIHLIPEERNDDRTIEIKKGYSQKIISLPDCYSEDHYVFIDEVGFIISMRASYGRSKKGSAAIHTVPNIRSMNISIYCAMNKSGILHY